MVGIHALDRLIGKDYPDLLTDEEVRAFEQVPYADRIAAESTFDAIKLGAARNPDGAAIQFLQNADPADTPLVVTYRDFIARVTQAANMFHALGAEKGDVISFMLPLVPDAFVTLFGAEAAGIANPVNPLLEPHQIAEITEAANTKIWWLSGRCRAPTSGRRSSRSARNSGTSRRSCKCSAAAIPRMASSPSTT